MCDDDLILADLKRGSKLRRLCCWTIMGKVLQL
jgi:hypothetical protein